MGKRRTNAVRGLLYLVLSLVFVGLALLPQVSDVAFVSPGSAGVLLLVAALWLTLAVRAAIATRRGSESHLDRR